jgi:hypothetical protein
MEKPTLIEQIKAAAEALRAIPRAKPPVQIHRNWYIPQGRAVENGGHIFMHPYDVVDLIHVTSGSDAALDALRVVLHERIDQIFGKKCTS